MKRFQIDFRLFFFFKMLMNAQINHATKMPRVITYQEIIVVHVMVAMEPIALVCKVISIFELINNS